MPAWRACRRSAAAYKGGKAGGAGNPMAWTPFPILKTRMSGEGREGRVVTIVPQSTWRTVLMPTPTTSRCQWTSPASRWTWPEQSWTSCKWRFPLLAAARRAGLTGCEWPSTVYFFSNPGTNPTAMFMQQKHELESSANLILASIHAIVPMRIGSSAAF